MSNTETVEPTMELTLAPSAETNAVLALVVEPTQALEQLQKLQAFVGQYLKEGEDFGVIPGTKKMTLLKPGADKLKEVYGLYADLTMEQRTEHWEFNPPLFDYEFKCVLKRRSDHSIVSVGVGSCNSYESRYRYRKGERLCPVCGAEAIIKGKKEYGGGWLCFNKKGGCGAKFQDGDDEIESQNTDKVENKDLADVKNTVLKMAAKRADVDATIKATRSSNLFTQDMDPQDAANPDDLPQQQKGGGYKTKAEADAAREGKKQASEKTSKATGTSPAAAAKGTTGTSTAARASTKDSNTTAQNAELNEFSEEFAENAKKNSTTQIDEEILDVEEIKSDRPTQEQLLQLFQVGTSNGWNQAQIQTYVFNYLKQNGVDVTSKPAIFASWTWKQFTDMTKHLQSNKP